MRQPLQTLMHTRIITCSFVEFDVHELCAFAAKDGMEQYPILEHLVSLLIKGMVLPKPCF